MKSKIDKLKETIKKKKEKISDLSNTIQKKDKELREQENLNRQFEEKIEILEKKKHENEKTITDLVNELANYRNCYSNSPSNIMYTTDSDNFTSVSGRAPTPVKPRVTGQSRDVRRTKKK